jgi:Cu-processing system permease protein
MFGTLFLLSSTANGIAVFMVFGAGLVAGLLGQIGEAIRSDTLSNVATTASWLLPFEALYQSALGSLTADTVGVARLAIDLGPFGGAEPFGLLLWPWALLYLGLIGALALRAFAPATSDSDVPTRAVILPRRSGRIVR